MRSQRERFSSTVMEKQFASPTEVEELAKQGLIEPAWKTPNEKDRVPDFRDLVF